MVEPSKMLYVLAILIPSMVAAIQTFRLLDRNDELASAKRDLDNERALRREAEQELRNAHEVMKKVVRGLSDRILGR